MPITIFLKGIKMKKFLLVLSLTACGQANDGADAGHYAAQKHLTSHGVASGWQQDQDGLGADANAERKNWSNDGVSSGNVASHAQDASVDVGDQYADGRHDMAEGYAIDRDGMGDDANDARQTASRDGLTTAGAKDTGEDLQSYIGTEAGVTRNYFYTRGPANMQNGRQAK